MRITNRVRLSLGMLFATLATLVPATYQLSPADASVTDCINKSRAATTYPVRIKAPQHSDYGTIDRDKWVDASVKVYYKRCKVTPGANYAKPIGVRLGTNFNGKQMDCGGRISPGHTGTEFTFRFRGANRTYLTSTIGIPCSKDTTTERYVPLGKRNSKVLNYGPKKIVPTWNVAITVAWRGMKDTHGATNGRLTW